MSPHFFRAVTALIAAVTFVAWLTLTPQARAADPAKRSILFDNLGYGELGVYGGGATRGAPTPRIDKLAGEGLRLTNMNMEVRRSPAGLTESSKRQDHAYTDVPGRDWRDQRHRAG